MPTVVWAGREWECRELPATAAGSVASLAASHRQDQLLAILGVLSAAGVLIEEVVALGLDSDDESLDFLDLVAEVLAVGSARPWRSTVGLCRSVVRQWSTIRGRLIEKGIADPLRALPSLTALLDVVEVMILDGMEKEEDRQRFLRDLYRRDTTSGDSPPVGWEDGANLDGLF